MFLIYVHFLLVPHNYSTLYALTYRPVKHNTAIHQDEYPVKEGVAMRRGRVDCGCQGHVSIHHDAFNNSHDFIGRVAVQPTVRGIV